ncbi:Hpt domain-containing protein [Thalassotalea hakodatensis]|uniref:Hpt domain-containing protein n=1 Tax=Thalassotalea hakodatensis TaxID=3030492 RepID=UPI0025738B4F|nr:Hpt domain-containing protein [Thalassotalea hakodatensis]
MFNNMKQLDTELLVGYIDNLGVDVVRQMLALYIEQSQIYLDDIAETVENENQSGWQEACHKMKGAAGSVGLSVVHQQLVQVEKSTDEWPRKREYLALLKHENQLSIITFETWLDSQ